MYDTEKRIELVKKISFTVAVVITALCIKFRKKDKRVRLQKIMYKERKR